MANTVALAPFGLTAIAWGYLIVSTVAMTLAALPALKVAFALPRKEHLSHA